MHAQFAAGKRRLEHVAGVHGAFRGARAHEGVELIHEKDDLSGLAVISFMTALSRSSNSPRYLVPATMAAKSRDQRLFIQ